MSKNRYFLYYEIGLFFLGVVLRLLFISKGSFWLDEVASYMIARLPFSNIPTGSVFYLVKNPPLFFMLLHFYQPFTGGSIFLLRLFPFFFGCLSLFFFLKLLKEIEIKDYLLPFFVGIVSPIWVFQSQELKNYSLLLFIILLSFWLFIKILKQKNFRWKENVFYFLSLTAGFSTHYLFVFVWLSQLITLIIFTVTKYKKPYGLIPLFSSCVILIPLSALVYKHMKIAPALMSPLDLPMLMTMFGNLVYTSGIIDLIFKKAIFVLGFIVFLVSLWGLLLALKRHHENIILVGMQVYLIFFGFIIAEKFVNHHFSVVRYFIIISPFVYILISYVLTEKFKKFGAGIVICIFSVSFIIFNLVRMQIDPHFARLSTAIRKSTPSESILLHTETYWYFPLKYFYLPEYAHLFVNFDQREILDVPIVSMINDKMNPLLRKKNTLWIDPSHKVIKK